MLTAIFNHHSFNIITSLSHLLRRITSPKSCVDFPKGEADLLLVYDASGRLITIKT
jgi:hypothetical protein